MYLFVIIDWYSRKIINYELLEKAFVLKCLKRALGRCQPEIMNSDQGSHFTNADYLELLTMHEVKVSMDGKGRARDNSRTEPAEVPCLVGAPGCSGHHFVGIYRGADLGVQHTPDSQQWYGAPRTAMA